MRREFSDIHERLWDPDRRMVRLAPGARLQENPGGHSVRNTILAAFFDLEGGRNDRANRALREVIAAADGLSGPADVVGCVLQLTELVHGGALEDDVRAALARSVERCVVHHPVDRHVPSSTNPSLMHAWMRGFVEPDGGEADACSIVERARQRGDANETDSPPDEGITLFALGLWVEHPPTPGYVAMGEELLDRRCRRLSALYHPGLAAICGPHACSDGLDLQGHVSLVGLWLALAGEPPARVLPRRLDEHTANVDDLFLLPAFECVRRPILERLHVVPVDEPRQWRAEFETIVAESMLMRDRAIGWEHGRRAPSGSDEYMPFVAHVERAGGVASLAATPTLATTGVDCLAVTPNAFQLTLRGSDGPFGVRLRSNEPFERIGDTYRSGPYIVGLAPYAAEELSVPSSEQTAEFVLQAQWSLADTTIRITIER